MRSTKRKNFISTSRTTETTLWRKAESSLKQQGILFDKANTERKRTSFTDEPKPQNSQTMGLLSLYTTPVPLADGISEKND